MPAEPSKDRHLHKRQSIDFGDQGQLWDELGEKIGPAERARLWRKFALAFLKKPGARIPRLKDYEPPRT